MYQQLINFEYQNYEASVKIQQLEQEVSASLPTPQGTTESDSKLQDQIRLLVAQLEAGLLHKDYNLIVI